MTKDVPLYAIVGGISTKIIRCRFSEELIQELLKIDYVKLEKEKIVECIDELYNSLLKKE